MLFILCCKIPRRAGGRAQGLLPVPECPAQGSSASGLSSALDHGLWQVLGFCPFSQTGPRAGVGGRPVEGVEVGKMRPLPSRSKCKSD